MRNRFHALCPYFAMFPESFAEKWIEKLTVQGDMVIDPFCGRGTAPFQALLMNRQAMGVDINPVAFCVSRAKTNAPSLASLRRRIRALEKGFHREDWESERRALPRFFRVAYCPNTLRQVLYLRHGLCWSKSNVDCMVTAMLLGALHGESRKSPSYLSNQMPRTISTKPAYSLRFWKRHDYRAPRRNAFELLRRLARFRYETPPPEQKGEVLCCDFRDIPGRFRASDDMPALAVTSPPYLDTTNFEEDQWLRLWFLGGPPQPTYRRISRDDRHEHEGTYWSLIADMWRVFGRIMTRKAHVVVRMGGKRLNPDRVVAGLHGAAVFSQRKVSLRSWEVSEIKRRQTDSFRPGAPGCRFEVDCWFQLD